MFKIPAETGSSPSRASRWRVFLCRCIKPCIKVTGAFHEVRFTGAEFRSLSAASVLSEGDIANAGDLIIGEGVGGLDGAFMDGLELCLPRDGSLLSANKAATAASSSCSRRAVLY